MRDTWPLLIKTDFPAITRDRLDTLQLNLGYLCNLSCIHCHVGAGPNRKELMDRTTMEKALAVCRQFDVQTLDLTGGSPEMNPDFRWLVEQARTQGIHVMDRLNPTIMEEPGYEWVGDFLAEHQVETIASLPCYSKENVDAQRGNGVFEASINALKKLNSLGYGDPESGLELNLVYNPLGPTLPPDQQVLEADYKRLLDEEFGILFNRLFTITNMPIQRFGAILLSKGQFDEYMALLKNAYQQENLKEVMCRNLISVDYRGFLYDCDFNQMLGLPLGDDGQVDHLNNLLESKDLPRRIGVADHCYGCTAGQGSSCGGALN
ncbi:arsenosugar biosynthesis radical SAM protein ArsS [Wenzhouxiangella sp. AB-CW3]|uniref:arsenosugar biosynthesis radical SAM (seleno)protein ArsS n=1 Tax=Wenzhouxiangella sp. AB-CW3 TaxID=2771012 RepID=UPI00168B61B5|nr:arsenosugar biosynthesis radical SAM (seleno)protein ArsS [Wenzhouxiangella sp. AB-CW3]QOC21448.1 arsenosugar biosynthesis radical SAM protein ArsS [Wenzhouxiangella sp. AB-CW3]